MTLKEHYKNIHSLCVANGQWKLTQYRVSLKLQFFESIRDDFGNYGTVFSSYLQL